MVISLEYLQLKIFVKILCSGLPGRSILLHYVLRSNPRGTARASDRRNKDGAVMHCSSYDIIPMANCQQKQELTIE